MIQDVVRGDHNMSHVRARTTGGSRLFAHLQPETPAGPISSPLAKRASSSGIAKRTLADARNDARTVLFISRTPARLQERVAVKRER